MLPVIYPLTTNSIGKTSHFFARVTFGSGISITWFGIMFFVLSNHHALVRLRTWPLNGIEAKTRSKALCLSVVIRAILSSSSY